MVSELAGRTLLTSADASGVGMDSELRGRLEVGTSGCVGVSGAGGDFAVTVFPHGTTWDASAGLQLDGADVPLGSEVALGGGFVAADVLQLEEVAPTCSEAGQVFLAR